MAKFAILTSATAGGAGIAAKRVFTAIKQSLTAQHSIELIDISALGEAVDNDVASHSGGTNKVFSDTHYTVEYPGYIRSFVVSYLGGFDVLNIHWSSYLVTLSEIRFLADRGVKIVFTCHDFYYLLGGCHYPHTCTNWITGCLSCPQIDADRFPLYSSADNKQRKSELHSLSNVFFTAPSQHLVDAARVSSGYSSTNSFVIRNPIDFNVFRPATGQRTGLLSQDEFKLLLIADSTHERRKGFEIATESIMELGKTIGSNVIKATIVGKGSDETADLLNSSGIVSTSKGHIADQNQIALVYQSVDAVLTASLEDNWPNVLVEAFACGTMIIAGPGHGCEEFISRYKCGSVSDSYSPLDFAKSAASLYNDMTIGAKSHKASKKGLFKKDHDMQAIAERFIGVYTL